MNVKEKAWYPVIYMFVVTAVFSSILIGFSRYTRGRVEVNRRVAFERAVVLALPLGVSDKVSSSEVHEIFIDRVAAPDEKSAGAWRMLDGEKLIAYALPIEGRGFWAIIKGAIGIEADGKTITGIAFYEQNETPGLGGEIVKPRFRAGFTGKIIAASGAPLVFKPEGSPIGTGQVHAITGATQTSARVERFLNEKLARWRDEMKKGGN
jgi:Na+-transporting NADH:ubiquinone oxidoreductase subunit C